MIIRDKVNGWYRNSEGERVCGFQRVWVQGIVKVNLAELLLLPGGMTESPNCTDLAFPEVDPYVLTHTAG